jgi:hypothetical protein
MERNSFWRKYLRQFKLRLLEFSHRAYEPIHDSETLSRFITSRGWFDRKKRIVLASAFMPRANGIWGTSIYRSHGTTLERLWKIGRMIADGTHDRVLYGRAVISANKVTSYEPVKMSLRGSVLPSLHRDIIGWPDDKGHQKIVAEYLARDVPLDPA